MDKTDYLDSHARVLIQQAHVLRDAGKSAEALTAARDALALYDRKGATFFVHQTQRLIEDWKG